MTGEESWRDVPGFDGSYQVSNLGRVRSVPRTVMRSDGKPLTIKGGLLQTWMKRSGHVEVNLGSGNPRRVHRIVLESFVGECPSGMMGCHNDGDPANNRLENLRWDTGSENCLDVIRHGRNPQVNRTECPLQHPYDLTNTYWYQGRRMCRKCRNMHAASSRKRAVAKRAIAA